MDRWDRVKSITVDASITGALWDVKGKRDALKDIRFEVDTKRQRLTTHFVGQGKRSLFEPLRVIVQRRDGAPIEARDEPERSIDGHQFETPWDDIHLAYFTGVALWTYLNLPFLCTQTGFITAKIAPIEVDGETWWRLKAHSPNTSKAIPTNRSRALARTGLPNHLNLNR